MFSKKAKEKRKKALESTSNRRLGLLELAVNSEIKERKKQFNA